MFKTAPSDNTKLGIVAAITTLLCFFAMSRISPKIKTAPSGMKNDTGIAFSDLEYRVPMHINNSVLSDSAASDYATAIYNAGNGLIFNDPQAVIDAFNALRSVNDIAKIAGFFTELYNLDMYSYISGFMTPMIGQDYMPQLNNIVAGLNGAVIANS